MRLVVGLGNPGSEYARTRHNVGFEVVAEVARRLGAGAARVAYEAEVCEGMLGTEKLLLLSPLTFMNLSGRSVAAAVNFYKLPAENVLIICDDLNLEAGRLRLRAAGSAGGQNGLKDIFIRLGTEELPRLRVGIGRPPGRMTATNYVLGRFTEAERAVMDESIHRAADGVERWVSEGIAAAMNVVNAAAE